VNKDELANNLRNFKSRRDNILHEDASTFDHHLERFLETCRTNTLVQQVLEPAVEKSTVDGDEWWQHVIQENPNGRLIFPSDPDDELALRYKVLEIVARDPSRSLFSFGIAQGKSKIDDCVDVFRGLILRPFLDELNHRVSEAADMVSPDERAVQAVPLARIPRPNEAKIFLSHKTADKPLVHRYYTCLKQLGFDPWLDEHDMPAGSNLERKLLEGFKQSCAAVFFITDNFKDEQYLATEVDYAIREKRSKGNKFAIIALRYSPTAIVPDLFASYIYKQVDNDLLGLNELLKALPVELGPVRWKAEVL